MSDRHATDRLADDDQSSRDLIDAHLFPDTGDSMSETQQSITDWADATFGSTTTNFRLATRANEEMAELLKCLATDPAHPRAAEEAADVVIVLARLVTRFGLTWSLDDTAGLPEWPPARFATHAAGQMAGLLVLFELDDEHEVAFFVRLVVSYMAALCVRLGTTLQAEIDRKMAVNYARTWAKDGTGHGYHVKPQEAPTHG